jgi:outer membrane lipoprotein carrier protein
MKMGGCRSIDRAFQLLALLLLAVFTSGAAHAPEFSVDDVLSGLEARYRGKGFSARFFQESTLKAMEVTDTAQGTILIKRPNMMRWEYERPDPQLIITDGSVLWIYRPQDRQVMIGEAPDYFGGGRGAGFITDIKNLRKGFVVVPDIPDERYHVLKLLPKEKKYGISSIRLFVTRDTFEIVKVATVNEFGDRTLLEFTDLAFGLDPDDSLFRFQIPAGTDVLQLEP